MEVLNVQDARITDTQYQPHERDRGRSILLPHQRAPIKHFAMDIGGTLAKIVYFEPTPSSSSSTNTNSSNTTSTTTTTTSSADNSNDNKANTLSPLLKLPEGYYNSLGGKIHFLKFETRYINDCLDFISASGLHIDRNFMLASDDDEFPKKTINITGGGAYKYANLIEKRLGVTLHKEDEMVCLIEGLNFLLKNIPRESFTYSLVQGDPNPKEFVPVEDSPYPYLHVQIGSGVSIIRVDSETSFQRVDGTSLGGGTFWGLCSLLTGLKDFDQMLDLSTKGESNNVDLVVGDIYGSDYSAIGLSSDVIASSFGKIIYQYRKGEKKDKKEDENESGVKSEEEGGQLSKADIVNSLLKMMCNNIAQIAYLDAMRFNLHRIYFGGFFIRDNPVSMQKISYAVNFWSKGKMKAMFLRHEGYLGALGAFLREKDLNKRTPISKSNTTDNTNIIDASSSSSTTTTTISPPQTQETKTTTEPKKSPLSVSGEETVYNKSIDWLARRAKGLQDLLHKYGSLSFDFDMSKMSPVEVAVPPCDCKSQFCEGIICRNKTQNPENNGTDKSSNINDSNT
eukprot:TRINITY_DN6134_c0_g2_i6.p1 TRINITY_DN6134_c0_g2~~TRINITY_DN6134_c0_g2_i6.p1  ORF type:complete len:566 (+),score=114.93 TRINITY_DN6134_c0_g2_i6:1370-3067(+)